MGCAMAYTPPGRTREKIMSWVRERLQRGEAPSVREVQEAFGFRSVESARAQLEALVSEGRLAKRAGRSRAYRLPAGEGVAESMASPGRARIPLLGSVPAGGLAEAVEFCEGWLDVAGLRPGDALFALKVTGESMRDAGILDGDVVVVRRQPTARSGEIIVAMVDDEATVKVLRRPRRRDGAVILEPRNPDYAPIVIKGGDVVILGKVIEVRRWLDRAPPLEEGPLS